MISVLESSAEQRKGTNGNYVIPFVIIDKINGALYLASTRGSEDVATHSPCIDTVSCDLYPRSLRHTSQHTGTLVARWLRLCMMVDRQLSYQRSLHGRARVQSRHHK